MALCIVSGTVADPSSSPMSGIPVYFSTQNSIVLSEPSQVSTNTASDGTWSLSIQRGLSGVVTVRTPSSGISRSLFYRFNVNIPQAATATFSSIVVDS